MAAYYVRNTGLDSNNGTSTATPFRTLQKALSVATTSDSVTQLPDQSDLSNLISTDAGNDLEVGDDGKLFYNAA